MNIALAPPKIAAGAGATAPALCAPQSVTLDITRLLSRILHPTPTGIDRVEFAYARALLAEQNRLVGFEAWLPGIGFAPYARTATQDLLGRLEAAWTAGEKMRPANAARALRGFRKPRPPAPNDLHLIVSHQHLDDLARRIRRGDDARTCVYIHDTIPSDFPEYARAGGSARHDRRMRNSIALANAVIVNSVATAHSVERFMVEGGRRPQLLVAPLGIEPRSQGTIAMAGALPPAPYFLCVGTIEPRKNHLLLLQLWRSLAERMPRGGVPSLVLVGRRGWENENVVDLLERSKALQGLVFEEGRVGDARLAALMAGARAVLMPSFAEGFGLPVAEALAAGVPVIASDIPVLRETGGDAPDYLDPLDGPAWIRAIMDYAGPDSGLRSAQMRRMARWIAPDWEAHFRRVLPFLDRLALGDRM